MKETRLTILVASLLVILSFSLIALRIKTHLSSRLAPGESVWRLSYDVRLEQVRVGTRLQLALPYSTIHGRIFREKFFHSGMAMDILKRKSNQGREAVVVVRDSAKQLRFLAYFDIYLRPKAISRRYREFLNPKNRARYLEKESHIQLKDPIVQQVLTQLRQQQLPKTKLLEKIFEYCSEQIAHAEAGAAEDAASTLRQRAGNIPGRARAMVALCRVAKIPARLTVGFLLENNQSARPHIWLQAYLKKRWLDYDPNQGYAVKLPASYVPVHYGSPQIIQCPTSFQAKYSIRRLPPVAGVGFTPKIEIFSIFDFTRLPAGMQDVLAILLLMPAGALITVIFRNLIGIRTFGTFTPCLLAFSFVYADWRTGLILFGFVIIIGLASRCLLNYLKLLIISRLSVILSLVVLCMAMAVSILDYLGLTPSARAVLLPMVITTMLIERFYITVEEDGYRYALNLMTGTIVVAFCCYILLRWQQLGRLVLVFPEAQLTIAALLLLLGRYSGYRLTELLRFRELAMTAREDD